MKENNMSLLKLTNQKQKNAEVSSDIRIAYFKVLSNKGEGFVCMSLDRPAKGSDSNKYRAAFSCYSPVDEKPFSKTNARNAAVGRVLNWRETHKNVRGELCETNPRLEFEYEKASPDEKFNLTDVFERGLVLAMENRAVPAWVSRSKAIGYGLNPDFNDPEQVVIR
jgi:hypothetical protein